LRPGEATPEKALFGGMVDDVTNEVAEGSFFKFGDEMGGGPRSAVVVGGNQAPPKQVLYHYTTEAGYREIMASGELLPSIGLKNARYGSGQYFTDIAPGTVTQGQLSARLFRVPWFKSKLTHFIEIDVTGLGVIKNKSYNFLLPSNTPLKISGRILGHGSSHFSPPRN
jgi:hypothetical protein